MAHARCCAGTQRRTDMKNTTTGYGDGLVHGVRDGPTSPVAPGCIESAFPERLRGGHLRTAGITGVRAGIIPALALLLLCAAAAAAPASDEPYRVLLLHSFRNSLPVYTDWCNGIVQGFTSVPDLQVEIDPETLDVSRFRDADYVSNLLHIYRHKYHDQKPHLIVPTCTPALRFLFEHGEELFPGIPIVFLGADNRFVAARELPPHITGITT